MEVILLEPVKNLGKTGEKVVVKNGFGRNYLIPRGVALRANKENLAVFEARRAEIEKDNAAKKAAAEGLGKKVNGQNVTIVRQAAEDGRLFGSVTVREIAEQLKAKNFDVDSKAVDLLTPIKALGVYKVRVSLHVDVAVEITVNVARSENEAEGQLAADAKATKAAEAESTKQSA
jgi:large subunit ribosomal protein L9